MKEKLGESGLEVSRLALGCWQFAGGAQWGEQAESDSVATVRTALERGINFFDTAPAYGGGESERVLGAALRGRRDEAVIATKLSNQAVDADGLRSSVERSLRLLETDRIDLLQIHWPNRSIPAGMMAEVLMGLKAAGKVRYIGVCNYGPLDMADYLSAGGELVSNQLPYSLLARAIEFEIEPACREGSVSILPYSPLQQGLLTGKFRTAAEVPDARARSRHFKPDRAGSRHSDPGCEEETFAALAEIRRVADELGVPMSHVALAWLLEKPSVGSILCGARNPQQVADNASALELKLDARTVERLDRATEQVKRILGKNPDLWSSESRYR